LAAGSLKQSYVPNTFLYNVGSDAHLVAMCFTYTQHFHCETYFRIVELTLFHRVDEIKKVHPICLEA
jgi:hypothetical protein